MSLDKAIKHGKERRKPKRKGHCKIVGCGSCEASRLYASRNKQHKNLKQELKAKGEECK